MSGGGGGGDVEMKMPDWLRPAGYTYGDILGTELGSIGNHSENIRPFFPGQTYAGMSPLTQAGIDQLTGPGGSAAGMTSDYFSRVMGGEYLGMNPAMQSAVMNPAVENVASRFAQAGRYGSPASQEQMAEAGMRAMAPYYDAERQRMGQAAMMLPGVQNQYAQNLLTAGGIGEGYEQAGIDEAMQRHYFNPVFNYLGQAAPLFGPGSGYGTQAQNTGGNTLPGMVGGALLGSQLAGPFGLPMGVALGAGGLLGGLMS